MHVPAPQSGKGQRRRKPRAMSLNIISLIDIFTVLVFFLLLNLTQAEVLPESNEVRLPESAALVTARDTVVVMVSREQILVQGVPVAKIADVMASTEPLIAPLGEALAKLPAPAAGSSSPDGIAAEAAPARELTIMGDRDISYQLLKKVLATCADADFGSISLAVLQKATPAGSSVVSVAR